MIYTDTVHLVSDKSDNELHEFAESIGLKREWFQYKSKFPHYDITTKRKLNKALNAGARLISKKALVCVLQAKELK